MTPNGSVERRARRRLGLALYLSRVRSNEVLGDLLEMLTVSEVDHFIFQEDKWLARSLHELIHYESVDV
jgi:hypothetical protein